MADALYPGALERIVVDNEPLVKWAVAAYCGKWVERIGYPEALAEARVGALKGAVAWLLKGGPDGGESKTRGKVNTYIVQGIRYHFGSAGFTWWNGPVRVNKKLFSSDVTRLRFTSIASPHESGDAYPAAEHSAFRTDDDPAAGCEAADRGEAASRMLELADAADPSGSYLVALSLHFGVGVRPASYREIGELLCVSKQGAQQLVGRALAAVREATRGVAPDV